MCAHTCVCVCMCLCVRTHACVRVCVCACVPSGLCPGSGSGGKRGQPLYENVWCLAPPGGAGLRLHAPNTEGWALSLLREQDPTRQRTTKSSHVEVLSHVQLCDPMDCRRPGSSVHGIFRQESWSGFRHSFSRRSSRPRDRRLVCCIEGRFFTTEPPGKSQHLLHTWAELPFPQLTRNTQMT